MNVKSVVKVMNFHSLLRVEKSRRKAEKFQAVQDELEKMMRPIVNNRNLQIDKLIKKPDPNNPVLRIYMGSDFGFCGSVNSYVSKEIREDDPEKTHRIIIGSKIIRNQEAELSIRQEEIEDHMPEISEILRRAVSRNSYSAIEIVYNRYCSTTQIVPTAYRIYPLEMETEEADADLVTGDYFVEGDAQRMFTEMLVLYLTTAIRIAIASAYASENITRRNVTQESLRKIDEREAEEERLRRKEQNRKSFAKTIDNYIKQEFPGREEK